MRNIYDEYELDLTPGQQEAYKRLGDRFEQVHRAAGDLGMEWYNLCNEGLMDEALNRSIAGDLDHLIESVESCLRELWGVGLYEAGDPPGAGESAANGHGPGTAEAGASGTLLTSRTVKERLRQLRRRSG